MSKRKNRNVVAAEVIEPTVVTELTEPIVEPETASEPAEEPKPTEPTETVEPTEPTETVEATEPVAEPKASRKFVVGAAVDKTIYGPFVAEVNLRFLRPATLTCILHDEIKARGIGTCAQLVARLRDQAGHNRYNEVAPKSETLRPFSSVNYWLKVWSKAGILTATAPEAETASEPTVETVENVA